MAEKNTHSQIWQNRVGTDPDLDLGGADLFRPVTHENVEYLLNKYSFLQMINTMALFMDEVSPKFVISKSGWTIHDYGDALASSPGEHLYGGGDYDTLTKQFIKKIDKKGGDEEEGEGEEGGELLVNPGKGTIINQAYCTAYDMVMLAIEKEWAGIKLVDGSPLMKWAAWAIAKNNKLLVEGYKATERDEERRERISDLIVFPEDAYVELEL